MRWCFFPTGHKDIIPNKILKLVSKISELDRIIDFSRAHIQLELVLHLMLNKCSSISDIVFNLKVPKKSIIDASRKLEAKGIITRTADKLCLTTQGEKFITNLISLVNLSNESIRRIQVSQGKSISLSPLALSERLYVMSIMHRILMELYSSPDGIEERKLAKRIKLSPYRLREYIKHANSLLGNPIMSIDVNENKIYKLNKHGVNLCKRIAEPYNIEIKMFRRLKLSFNILTMLRRIPLMNTIILLLASILLMVINDLYVTLTMLLLLLSFNFIITSLVK